MLPRQWFFPFPAPGNVRDDLTAEDLDEHIPYVKDMKFLGNVEYMEGVEGGIEISDLIEEIPETSREMKLVRERAACSLRLSLGAIGGLFSGTGHDAAV